MDKRSSLDGQPRFDSETVWQRLKTLVLGLIAVGLVTTGVIVTPRISNLGEPLQRDVVSDEIPRASLAPAVNGALAGLVDFERSEDEDYIVADGETLSEIARRFGVDSDVLARRNDIGDPHRIAVGQRLVIPAAELPPP